MDRKDSYTEVFLKAAGVEADVKKTKDFKAIWWYSTREKDIGGLRMTDHCLEFVETKSEIKTYKIEIPKEIKLSTAENSLEEIKTIPASHFNEGITPLENDLDQEDDSMEDQRISPLNFKFNLNNSEVTEDSITFEPLHTSDYFASLGIKLSNKVLHSDKLGKQMKSFTEWLKDMKKLQPDQIPLQSEQADLTIQKLAEASNLEIEVETEAMAEVLIQQGKKQKAIKVYKKLSLLNPSKSAYFAAKIDQLKDH